MIRFYKPNPKNSGHAASFYYNKKHTSIFVTLVKQDSWDATKRIGSFAKSVKNPEKNLTLKISVTEAAGMIDALERLVEFGGFHDAGRDSAVSFKFAPYEYQGKHGFSLSVTRTNKADTQNKVNFLIGFSQPEMRLIREHLIYLLHQHFAYGDLMAERERGDFAASAVPAAPADPEPEHNPEPETNQGPQPSESVTLSQTIIL